MIIKESFTFPGAFTIVGEKLSRFINGAFIIKDEIELLQLEKIGYASNHPDNLNITGIKGVKGKITEALNKPVNNAIVTIKKNGFIIDKVRTDKDGNYIVFIPDGAYDIEINSSKVNRAYKNYEIKNGIRRVYCIPKSGEIFRHYEDSVSFLYKDSNGVYDTKDFLINGQILDFKNNPVQDAEIIVSKEDEVAAYVTTDEMGKYHFMLTKGEYEVRIRIPKQHLKIAKIVFDGNGFISNVSNNLRTV